MILVGGRCWGHGASKGGFRQFESATCVKCGKKLRWRKRPRTGAAIWTDGVLWFEGEPQCTGCARARHSGCPCGFVETGSR